jgi:hypothetical protein
MSALPPKADIRRPELISAIFTLSLLIVLRVKMSPLSNSRHEKFAQELATGRSAADAYLRAGYKANYGNCIRLKANERVAARITELKNVGAARAEVR